MKKPVKPKKKHRQIAEHHALFVDKNWWPDFILTDELAERFIRYESRGPKSLSVEELESIIPLTGSAEIVGAKGLKELTIRMIYEECAEWWSKGWGWSIPIEDNIRHLWREKVRDRIFIRAQIKMLRAMRENFLDALLAFTGLSFEEKQKYIKNYLKTLDAIRI